MKKRYWLYLLHGLFLFYSLVGIGGKIAASFSWKELFFWIIYCMLLVFMAIYAIGWQIILQHLPLSTAYVHRSITVFWGTVLGYFFFHESITFGKLIGVLLVMCGIIIFDVDWRTDDA